MNQKDQEFWQSVKVKPSGEWEEWFVWYPVTLLTMEIAWLRKVQRRPWTGRHYFSNRKRKYDYANL